MLLFKKKNCLQCISHPFSSEHDLCEEMVFLKIKLEICPCTMLL